MYGIALCGSGSISIYTHTMTTYNTHKNQQERKATFEKYREFIFKELCYAKGKGSRKKKDLYSHIYYLGNKVFDCEEEEYQAIGKYRGRWRDHPWERDSPEELIIREIALGYGCFNY